MGVYYSNFESGNVPWCWTGVDSLVLRDSGNVERTVTLGTLSSADDSAAIATAVTAAITGSATCALSGGKYTITLPAAHDVLWSKSTFNSVFKDSKTDESSKTTIVLEGEEVSPTPALMELHIDAVNTGTSSGRGTSGDIIFPRAQNQPLRGLLSLDASTSYSIQLKRLNSTRACPTSLSWDILLSRPSTINLT